jgi:hypothetical protein
MVEARHLPFRFPHALLKFLDHLLAPAAQNPLSLGLRLCRPEAPMNPRADDLARGPALGVSRGSAGEQPGIAFARRHHRDPPPLLIGRLTFASDLRAMSLRGFRVEYRLIGKVEVIWFGLRGLQPSKAQKVH